MFLDVEYFLAAVDKSSVLKYHRVNFRNVSRLDFQMTMSYPIFVPSIVH
jgi:hypothetical protein